MDSSGQTVANVFPIRDDLFNYLQGLRLHGWIRKSLPTVPASLASHPYQA